MKVSAANGMIGVSFEETTNFKVVLKNLKQLVIVTAAAILEKLGLSSAYYQLGTSSAYYQLGTSSAYYQLGTGSALIYKGLVVVVVVVG